MSSIVQIYWKQFRENCFPDPSKCGSGRGQCPLNHEILDLRASIVVASMTREYANSHYQLDRICSSNTEPIA
jgi:hypothetical protein